MIELQPSGVTFIKDTHQYFRDSDGKELRGITSTLVAAAFPHDYDDISEETLRRAAERGTAIHDAIERYEADDDFSTFDELSGYIDIKAENHLRHERSEYIVTDGERYASAIDLVMTDKEGHIVLCDIKTTYEPHYEKTALQLSIYKWMFEMQNPGLQVSRIAMIWLRGTKREYRELTPWADEVIDSLIDADASGKPFDITKAYGDLPARVAQVEDEVVRLEMETKAAKERQDELRKGLYDLMEQYGVKTFTGQRVRLTRVLPSESVAFDSKRFKEDHPDLYAEYCRKQQRAGSLKITIF